MDIAMSLGLANPDDLDHLPHRIYEEWFAYFSDGPFFWRILDAHFSRLEALFANAWRGKGVPLRKVSDFQIFATIKSQPTGAELMGQLLFLNRLYGGDVIDHRSGDGK